MIVILDCMTNINMTTSYTYVRRKNNYLFRYPSQISKIAQIPNNYAYLSTAKKIAYAIKNYPSRKSFYFDDWEDLRWVVMQLINELGHDNCIKGKIGWNEFIIKYKDEEFNITRSFSSDLAWKSYDISKN